MYIQTLPQPVDVIQCLPRPLVKGEMGAYYCRGIGMGGYYCHGPHSKMNFNWMILKTARAC